MLSKLSPRSKMFVFVSLMVLASLVLTACGENAGPVVTISLQPDFLSQPGWVQVSGQASDDSLNGKPDDCTLSVGNNTTIVDENFSNYVFVGETTHFEYECKNNAGSSSMSQDITISAAATADAESVPAQSNTPAAQAENSTKVDGNVVKVFSEGKLIAEVTFVTTVDNMPTEWLRDREGVSYLYQSGIGNEVDLKVTLYDGGSFAIDGDWMVYGGADLGKINDSADFRAFADKPGTYTFSASSFGLAVGPYRANDDKAGFVLADRRSADNGDNRPEYWLDPTGKSVEIGQ